jgi:hypothetical protein
MLIVILRVGTSYEGIDWRVAGDGSAVSTEGKQVDAVAVPISELEARSGSN